MDRATITTEAWGRDVRIDVLRGVLVLLMVCNHIPSVLGEVTSRAL
ncbi:MAG: OpgC protein, partial [Planctomycetota bacterium]